MHAQFADWYRQATLERDDGFLKKRWKLVETTVQGLTPLGALELVRLHFGLPSYDRSAVSGLFDAVKDAGPSYARPELTVELRILAGAGLACLLEQGQAGPRSGHVAIIAALAILCLQRLDDRMSAGPSRELLGELANHLLTLLSGTYRQHSVPKISLPGKLPGLPAVQIENKKYRLIRSTIIPEDRNYSAREKQDIIEVEIPSITDLNEWNVNANKTLTKYWSTLATALDAQLEQYANFIPQLHTALHEENNILWWLFGEASNELCCPFADLSPAARCLVVGKELADLTRVIPGPRAALAFLDRALRSGGAAVPGELALAEAVANLRPDWRQRAAATIPLQLIDVCPIHYTLRGGAISSPGAAADVPAAWAPLDLAHQMYREQLMGRLFEGMTMERQP